MPRQRTIHPGFWTDAKVSRLPCGARLAFLWALNAADDDGRFRCDAQTLSSEVFRYDPAAAAHAQEHIDLLVATGRWVAYREKANGEPVFMVARFHVHQAPNRPVPSRLPPPPADVVRAYQARFGPLPLTRDEGRTLIAAPFAPGLSHGQSVSEQAVPAPAADDIQAQAREVFEYWKEACKRAAVAYGRSGRTGPRRLWTEKRRRKLAARLREGYTPSDLMLAVDGCMLSPFHQGKNDGATLFDDLELICRDASKVDSFMARAQQHATGTAPGDAYIAEVVNGVSARSQRLERLAGLVGKAAAPHRRDTQPLLSWDELGPIARDCTDCEWPALVCARHHSRLKRNGGRT